MLLVLSFVQCSPLSKHRALDRAFWCSLRGQNRGFWCFPSCRKSCFLVLPCQKPWSRSCFLVLSFVPKIVLFGALLRARNRAFWCFPSCQKLCSRSCFLVLSFVPKIVLWIVLADTAIRLVLKQRYLQCCILMITSWKSTERWCVQ